LFPWFDRLLHRAPNRIDSIEQDPLLVFDSETTVSPQTPDPPARWEQWAPASATASWTRTWVPIAGVAAIIALAGVAGWPRLRGSAPAAAAHASGTLTVDTRPSGADVTIDGERRGTAPLSLTLPAGAHTMTVRQNGDERTVSLQIAANAALTEHIELMTKENERLAALVAPPVARKEPAVPRERSTAPIGGWVALTAPFEVQVQERNEVVGTSATAKFMLAAGRHDVVLGNDALGYRETRRLDVVPGKTTTIRVDAPRTAVSLNALPWAEVTVDGVSVGQTPIANTMVTIGRHTVVFRHPSFAERSQTITATRQGPNRFSVDLTK
jgi:PEGA domain